MEMFLTQEAQSSNLQSSLAALEFSRDVVTDRLQDHQEAAGIVAYAKPRNHHQFRQDGHCSGAARTGEPALFVCQTWVDLEPVSARLWGGFVVRRLPWRFTRARSPCRSHAQRHEMVGRVRVA
jgi:hypothetical protein